MRDLHNFQTGYEHDSDRHKQVATDIAGTFNMIVAMLFGELFVNLGKHTDLKRDINGLHRWIEKNLNTTYSMSALVDLLPAGLRDRVLAGSATTSKPTVASVTSAHADVDAAGSDGPDAALATVAAIAAVAQTAQTAVVHPLFVAGAKRGAKSPGTTAAPAPKRQRTR